MKQSRFTEERIIGILREHEAGSKTGDICRKHGISSATFSDPGCVNWRRFGGVLAIAVFFSCSVAKAS